MEKFALIAILTFILSACESGTLTIDPSTVQTAIAQTAAANPTATLLPPPTKTPMLTATSTPTETATQTPSSTPTETPSPTPDIRVIDADPYTFLLKAEDLPEDAYYYLPNSAWISPHRNYEVVSGWTVDKGRAYLAATGRVDGWWVEYERGTNTVIAPEQIYDNPVLFRTVAGAQLLLTQFGTCVNPDLTPGHKYIPVQTELKIGDITNVCLYREMQSNGEYWVDLCIEFSYRNVAHGIDGLGREKDVQLDYLAAVAHTLLAKLEAMPLSDSVTFEP
jgi:hypothetical protein